MACGADAVAGGPPLAAALASSNLWPNASSETSPPSGTIVLNDGSSPDWDYRVNVGASAYDGAWVRDIDNNHIDYGTGQGGEPKVFRLKIPCVPGDRFFVSAAVRITALDPSHALGTSGAGVYLTFVDANGHASGSQDLGRSTSSSWTVVQTHAAFPASADSTAVAVLIGLSVDGGTRAQFDAITVTKL